MHKTAVITLVFSFLLISCNKGGTTSSTTSIDSSFNSTILNNSSISTNSSITNNSSSSISSSSEIKKKDLEEYNEVFYNEMLSENTYETGISIDNDTFLNTSKWIWNSDFTTNKWVKIRKTFDLEKIPEEVYAKIGVESKYWLYINGELVVYEGGLKRGVDNQTGYYDNVEISKYLKKGTNVISVEAWYWGSKGKSYSNVPTGKPGFIFEANIGDVLIQSDNTWKIKTNNAYNSVTQNGEEEPNYRLPEYNISYNATLEEDSEWKEVDFDDSGWENAKIQGKYGDYPWNELVKRPIPLNKDFGYSKYLNSDDYKNYTTTETTTLIMKVGTNIQLSPVLKIYSNTANLKISISTECTIDSQGNSVRAYYYTKIGEQEFEVYGHINGQYVYYEIPSGVTILELGYRQTGYDSEKSGSFTSGDAFYDRIWQMSYDTLYVTMRDVFMDCPNRERAQWMGDVTNEMEQTLYCMDENSYLLYEKAIDQVLGFTTIDGILPTVAPISASWFELPIQNLCTISGAWTYYLYTGRDDVIEKVYPYFYRYLKLWKMDSNGLVIHRPGSWDWMDNDAVNPDTSVIENGWYYKALTALENMAILVGDEFGQNFTKSRKESIYTAYNDLFYTSNGYKSSGGVLDDKANAIAVLSGLVPEDRYPAATKALTNVYKASPYWEKFVLEALCEMGEYDTALIRMKDRYTIMTNYSIHDGELYSTLWEKWNTTNGTKNHAWSGGPMTILSKYILGVQPLTSNYQEYLVKPNSDILNNVTGQVPTLNGQIDVTFNYANDTFEMDLSSPTNTNAIVSIPYFNDINKTVIINNEIVCEDGYIINEDYIFAGKDSNYLYFNLPSGNYDIKVY